jgi:two-component system KDP operon response regulator KdpE
MPDAGHVLIIEDEADIRKYLRLTLAAQGYGVTEASTARDGLAVLAARRPDVVLLDLGLPDMDGQDVIRHVREWSEVPIVVLSARERESDKVEALESGADDYLTKPFAPGELLARIRVALRHGARRGEKSAVFESDGLKVDLAARVVTLDGNEIHLTPIEYKLLATLVAHAGKVLTHSHLLKEVWGKHATENTHYLRIHTQHLREKLGDDPLSPRFIITEPGIGYRLKTS